MQITIALSKMFYGLYPEINNKEYKYLKNTQLYSLFALQLNLKPLKCRELYSGIFIRAVNMKHDSWEVMSDTIEEFRLILCLVQKSNYVFQFWGFDKSSRKCSSVQSVALKFKNCKCRRLAIVAKLCPLM